jgi:ADP-ribosyl-[dinitrogen reductase] hydrolase
MKTRNLDRYRGCLLGLAVGDAIGTTVEFKPRGSFLPVIDMIGGGAFHLQPGQWTDDTSMALCLATSLVECGGFDARDQMERYCRWLETGYLSSRGSAFGLGRTVGAALRRFRRTGEPFAGSSEPNTAGNGCIMRLAPIPMFFFPDIDAAARFAAESSRTTHGAEECLDACRLLARIIIRALLGRPKDEVALADGFVDSPTFVGSPNIAAIAGGDYRQKSEAMIRGSGYVVECLEAALWCFMHTDTYRDAVLKAANLGDDADTTAAVCGQVAGAYYGESDIPAAWLEKLVLREEIRQLADRLVPQ